MIDLRLKLQLPESSYRPKETSIIISEIGDLVLGVIVDDVEEVASYEEAQIETNIEVQSKIGREYLYGVAKTADQRIVLLLNINHVLNVQEIEIIKKNTK